MMTKPNLLLPDSTLYRVLYDESVGHSYNTQGPWVTQIRFIVKLCTAGIFRLWLTRMPSLVGNCFET